MLSLFQNEIWVWMLAHETGRKQVYKKAQRNCERILKLTIDFEL